MPIGAFLVGEKVQEEDQDLIYIYGAIQMCEVTVKGQDIQIQDAGFGKMHVRSANNILKMQRF